MPITSGTGSLKSISSGLAFELKQYINNGGNVLLFPPNDAELASWNTFLNAFPDDVVKFTRSDVDVELATGPFDYASYSTKCVPRGTEETGGY